MRRCLTILLSLVIAVLGGRGAADAASEGISNAVRALEGSGTVGVQGMAALLALLGAGASPDGHIDEGGRTALHLAARLGRADAVGLLLEHKASPSAKDAQGNTPLHIAVIAGYAGVARALLRGGASPSVPNTLGMTPAHIAAFKGHNEIAALINLAQPLGEDHRPKAPTPPAPACGDTSGCDAAAMNARFHAMNARFSHLQVQQDRIEAALKEITNKLDLVTSHIAL